MKRKDKSIDTLVDLQDFCISTIYAIGDISKVEAEEAINKAYFEFRERFRKSFWSMVEDYDSQ